MKLRIHPGKMMCVTANHSMQKISIYKMRNTQTAKTKLYSCVQTQPDVTYQPKWLTYFLIQYSLFMRHLFWAASGSFVNHIWARESSFTNAFVVTLACSELCVQCLTILPVIHHRVITAICSQSSVWTSTHSRLTWQSYRN